MVSAGYNNYCRYRDDIGILYPADVLIARYNYRYIPYLLPKPNFRPHPVLTLRETCDDKIVNCDLIRLILFILCHFAFATIA